MIRVNKEEIITYSRENTERSNLLYRKIRMVLENSILKYNETSWSYDMKLDVFERTEPIEFDDDIDIPLYKEYQYNNWSVSFQPRSTFSKNKYFAHIRFKYNENLNDNLNKYFRKVYLIRENYLETLSSNIYNKIEEYIKDCLANGRYNSSLDIEQSSLVFSKKRKCLAEENIELIDIFPETMQDNNSLEILFNYKFWLNTNSLFNSKDVVVFDYDKIIVEVKRVIYDNKNYYTYNLFIKDYKELEKLYEYQLSVWVGILQREIEFICSSIETSITQDWIEEDDSYYLDIFLKHKDDISYSIEYMNTILNNHLFRITERKSPISGDRYIRLFIKG